MERSGSRPREAARGSIVSEGRSRLPSFLGRYYEPPGGRGDRVPFLGFSARMYWMLYWLFLPKTWTRYCARSRPCAERPSASLPSASLGGFSPCRIR
jgi:hypothetical protein